MRATKTLRVLPNPWMHIHVYADDVPRPAGVVGVDMVEHIPAPNRYVGARIARTVTVRPGSTLRVGKAAAVRERAREEIYWAFESEPVTIPNTGYYRDNLKAGALLPADEETARAAGLQFIAPEQALAAAKASAVAAFDALHGIGAFEAAQPEPEAKAAPTNQPAPEAGPPASDRSTSRKARSKE